MKGQPEASSEIAIQSLMNGETRDNMEKDGNLPPPVLPQGRQKLLLADSIKSNPIERQNNNKTDKGENATSQKAVVAQINEDKWSQHIKGTTFF